MMVTRLRVVMGDNSGRLIRHGENEFLDVDVHDEFAEFHFQNYATTQRFCALFQALEKKEFGIERSKLNESRQSFVTLYPDMKEDDLARKLKKDFAKLGGGIVNG